MAEPVNDRLRVESAFPLRGGWEVEMFVDGVDLHNEGQATTSRYLEQRGVSHANAAGNLLDNSVYFPLSLMEVSYPSVRR